MDGYIRDLLFDHDCVIVMDLGGFIAHYHAASINEALHLITPPSKKVAFNAALKTNDGLLAHHISFLESLSYQDACQVIREYSELIKSTIKTGSKYKMEKVGVLFSDSGGNIQFLPDSSTNFLADSFGLPVIQAVALHGSQSDVAENERYASFKGSEAEENESNTLSRAGAKSMKVMEMIPAAAILILLFMAPPLVQRFNMHLGSLVPFTRIDEFIAEKNPSTTGEELKVEAATPSEVNADADHTEGPEIFMAEEQPSENTDTVTIADSEAQTVPEKEVFLTNKPIASTGAEPGSFHIIVGSFKNKSNALKLVQKLTSNYRSPVIVYRRGKAMHLVSVYAAESESDAEAMLPKIRAEVISSAWVLDEASLN